jgi:hypothetical protein
MGVVINEFEVVAESAPAPRRASGEAAEAPPAEKPMDPAEVKTVLRTIEAQALRVWAH